jgi:chondroitin AC lyase
VLGASNGKSGCFTYDYNKDGVKAHRSWFCFGHEIVVMVAALNNQTTHNVYHSINQSFLKGDVYADSKLMSTETLSKNGVRSVWHDSIAYLFQPSDYNIQLSRKNQSGSWHDISTAQSNDSISKPVFSLGIDLGKNNEKGSFAYTIVPNCGIKDVQKLVASKTISILQNTAEQQIVWNTESNCLQAAVYSPSVVSLPWQKMSLELTKPGVLVIERMGNMLKMKVQQEGVKAQERVVKITQNEKIKM